MRARNAFVPTTVPKDAATAGDGCADKGADNSPVSALDFDTALESAGGFGFAQACALLVLGVTYALGAWAMYLPMLHAGSAIREVTLCNNKFLADGSSCSTGLLLAEGAGCEAIDFSWRYVDPLKTVSAEWDLTCARSKLRAAVGTVYFIGGLVGGPIFSRLADAKGRCLAFCVSTWFTAASVALCGLASSFSEYLVGQGVAGAGIMGFITLSFVWAGEMLPSSQSSRVGILNTMFPLGVVVCVGMDLIVPRWRSFTMIYAFLIACCGALGMIAWRCGLESPAWLASRGDAVGVQRVAATLARLNRVSYTPVKVLSAEQDVKPSGPAAGGEESSLASVRWQLCALSGGYIACKLGYNGLSLSAENFGSGLHASIALMSLVEVPAVTVSQIAINWSVLGRRGTLVSTLMGTAACCILSTALQEASALAVSLCGKFFVTAAFNTVMVYASEVFPAAARSSAMGMCAFASGVVGAGTPILVAMPMPWPALIIGAVVLVLTVPLLTLPETLAGAKAEAK